MSEREKVDRQRADESKGLDKFGNRGHVTISQPTKPSERPRPKPPSSDKK